MSEAYRKPEFIHLGVRSSFSLLESMITSSDIKNWAIANDIPAVAVTDHNNLFGALEISEYLAGEGVQPIVGVSFDILPAAHDSTTYKKKREKERKQDTDKNRAKKWYIK